MNCPRCGTPDFTWVCQNCVLMVPTAIAEVQTALEAVKSAGVATADVTAAVGDEVRRRGTVPAAEVDKIVAALRKQASAAATTPVPPLPHVIQTDAGPLRLVRPTPDQVADVSRYAPMGIRKLRHDDADVYGFVFQTGPHELTGLKFQQVEFEGRNLAIVTMVNRLLIAAALPTYVGKGHRGLLLPCTYARPKPGGKTQTGIAYFLGPDAASKELLTSAPPRNFDGELGVGATAMINDMALAVVAASRTTHLPLQPFISHKLRPKAAIGVLAIHFLVQGSQVFVVKAPLDDREPVWKQVVEAGFSELPYLPLVQTTVPEIPTAS
jgi:hypothetical protein